MANEFGKAYALCALSPIKNGYTESCSYAETIRERLQSWPLDERSPFAKVPETYLARMFVLDQVFFEGSPATLDYLASSYLVLASYFHGDRDAYLRGMWTAIRPEIEQVFGYCVAFTVTDAASFAAYIGKCQLTTSLFFMGSTDDSLEEQLKSLYLKQEFARFAAEHQGADPAALQQAFSAFVARVEPENLAGPSWRPGQTSL
jgi:hypothetical protein